MHYFEAPTVWSVRCFVSRVPGRPSGSTLSAERFLGTPAWYYIGKLMRASSSRNIHLGLAVALPSRFCFVFYTSYSLFVFVALCNLHLIYPIMHDRNIAEPLTFVVRYNIPRKKNHTLFAQLLGTLSRVHCHSSSGAKPDYVFLLLYYKDMTQSYFSRSAGQGRGRCRSGLSLFFSIKLN